jgi:MFS family permease
VTTDARAEPWPSPRRAWFLVAVLMLGYFFAFVDRQILSLLVVPIQAQLGVTDTQLGLLQGLAFAIFYSTLGLPLGRLADRANRRNLLVAGVTLWSLATAACGLADSYGELFAARIVVGVGEATLAPVAVSLIADYFEPARRAVAMSVYVAAGSIGAGAALLLGGYALSHATRIPGLETLEPWQATFVAVGLPGVLVAMLLLSIREPKRRERSVDAGSRRGGASFRSFLRAHAGFVALHVGGMAVFSAMSYALLSWIPTFLVRHHGLSLQQAGVAFGVAFAICGPLGAVWGGLVARRWQAAGREDALMRTVVLGTGTAGLAYGLGAVLPTAWLAVAAFGIGTFCSAFPSGPAVAALTQVARNELRGQMTALYYLGINLVGLGLGPLVVGVLTDHVFRDRAAVGHSMLIVAIALGPASALLLRCAFGPFRRAVAARQHAGIGSAAHPASALARAPT